eukprot:scaffold38481_cov84-Phaeocystis_antarctica.AAC.2
MTQGAHPLADAELLEVFVGGAAHLDVDVEHEEALQARGCMQAGLTGLQDGCTGCRVCARGCRVDARNCRPGWWWVDAPRHLRRDAEAQPWLHLLYAQRRDGGPRGLHVEGAAVRRPELRRAVAEQVRQHKRAVEQQRPDHGITQGDDLVRVAKLRLIEQVALAAHVTAAVRRTGGAQLASSAGEDFEDFGLALRMGLQRSRNGLLPSCWQGGPCGPQPQVDHHENRCCWSQARNHAQEPSCRLRKWPERAACHRNRSETCLVGAFRGGAPFSTPTD